MQATAKTSDGLDLSKYWLIFRRRWPPAVLTALGLFGLLFWNLQNKPSIYQAKGLLRFNLPDTTSGLIGLSGVNGSPRSYYSAKDPLMTEIQEIQSRDFLNKVAQHLKNITISKDSLGSDDLSAGLLLSPVQETDVVKVSFENVNPKLAAQVVNQVMEIYIQTNLQTNRSKASMAREFMLSQLPKVHQRVFVADTNLRKFKETYRIGNVDAAKSSTSIQVKLQEQLDTIDARLASLEAQSTSVRHQFGINGQQALTINTVSQSPAVQGTLKSIELTKKELAQAQGRFGPDHPAIAEIQERQQRLQAVLKENINQTLSGQKSPAPNLTEENLARQDILGALVKNELTKIGLLRERQTLLGKRSTYLNQSKILPSLEQQERELKRELVAAESTYGALLKSLQDIRVTENQIIPTVKIIETASVPVVAVSPKKVIELLRIIIVSLLGAAGVIYLLEKTDRKLKTVDSIREAYPYPLLGNIPEFEGNNSESSQLPSILDPSSLVSEAYRMLQANLKFLRSDNAVRVIAVSSAQPGEGKSVTASNLSAVLSQLGHRVLLIDADLRRPTLHQIWEIKNVFGLSNILTAPEEEKAKLELHTHKVNENLHILSAGVIPPNPLALLDSQRMSNLLRIQSELYDYILIDTPPLTVSADPLVISGYSDGLLLVARPDKLEKGSSNFAQNILLQSSTNVLGVVANGVLLKNETYDYYQYSKSYYSPSDSSKKTSRSSDASNFDSDPLVEEKIR
jgi:polysaccharide biosynthesis transport protein